MNVRALFFVSALLFITGCDKLKAAAGGGGEGGAPIVGDIFSTDFEGEITSKVTNASTPGKPQLVTFGIKRPKYRMDLTEASAPAPQMGSVILDIPTKQGWLLIHPQKLAMPLDLTKPIASPQIPGMPSAPKTAPTHAPSSPPKVDKTGKKDTVAGYTCEIWNITSDGKLSEVCMAENLTWIDMGDIGFQNPELALSAAATGGNHFPLRVITHDAAGKEQMRMEAQKVEKKKLDDTRFVPPADYKQFHPGQMPPIPSLPAKGH
jgi:hypothetical protein